MGKPLTKRIHPFIIEELRADIAGIDIEDSPELPTCQNAIEKLAQNRIAELTPEERNELEDLMYNISTKDQFVQDANNQRKWHETAACIPGCLTLFDENTIYSGHRRPRKIVIDGITYERW